MSIFHKIFVVSIVNILSAIGIITVINVHRHKRCFIKCTTATKQDKKHSGEPSLFFDKLADILQSISNSIKSRKTFR